MNTIVDIVSRFTKGWVFKNRARLLLIAVGVAGTVVLLVSIGRLGRAENNEIHDAFKRVLYLVSLLINIGIITLWLLRSKSFRDDLQRPKEICSTKDYIELYATYEHFRAMRPNETHSGYGNGCKWAYIAFWVAYTAFIAYALTTLDLDTCSTALLAAFTVVATLLNGVSYYKCAVYVWFLKRIADCQLLLDERYFEIDPSLTPSFRTLEIVANSNATAFLAMTLLFAITMLADLMLFPDNLWSIYTALLCYMLVTVVGLATYLVLVIYSRKYLNRMLSDWTSKSVGRVLEKGKLAFSTRMVEGGSNTEADKESLRMLAANHAALKGRSATALRVVLSICIALIDLLVALSPLFQANVLT